MKYEPRKRAKSPGMTLVKAKELARKQHGKLPRPGYEVPVERGETPDGHRFTIWLQNNGGRYVVRKYVSVNVG